LTYLPRQLQNFSLPDPVDPFGVAFGVIPVRRNDSLPGKGLRAGPFDDGIIPFGSLPEFTPSEFGLYPLHVNKTRHLKP
jgi:hypothetical protein